jgi:DNA-binding CsgD family transcriptional regulator
MLETELFALLDCTADAAYTVTSSGKICSWNAAAERLLGYLKDDVIGRNIDAVLQARDAPSGARTWVNISTIIFDNRRTGDRLFVRLARDITQRVRNDALVLRVLESARQLVAQADDATDYTPTAPLSDQELRVLKLFAEGRNSTAIARALKISPQTLRNHLHHINEKLGTHTRLEAVTHAQRRGLIG